jgi:inosose dehydratase
VPNYELLPYLDKKVKEYGFNFAIHLHGPDIATYPDAEDVWNYVKDLDPRIGMCLDIGHDTRNGKDDMTDPFMGIAESIGYFRGVIATTKK